MQGIWGGLNIFFRGRNVHRVLVFTDAAPRLVSTSSGKKTVSRRSPPLQGAGALSLRTGTGWRAFFQFCFGPPGPYDLPGEISKSFAPVIKKT